MKKSVPLLAAAIAGGLLAPSANAATTHKKHPVRHHAAAKKAAANQTQVEIAELKAEVSSLRDELEHQRDQQAGANVQLAETRSQVSNLQTQVAANPTVTSDAVREQVAAAIEKQHRVEASDHKGVQLKVGGFLEMAGIYRDHFQGNDIGSSYSIPFPNNRASHTSETRFSARQSRLSLLAQGKPNKDMTLTMYGEFDFLGGAQTANSNESNSYNPRIRNIYGAIDWDKGGHGWHLLAGQNWSLVTMNTKGITPRNELTPPQIDAQYVPGFVWTRQPQVRVTGDFLDHHLWIAVSAENAATTFAGSVPSLVTNTVSAGSGFDAANVLSLNHIPDLVGKVAYEGDLGGHSLHVEGFALSRTFTAHLNGGGDINKGGYGFGGGIVFQAVPKLLDLQFSGMVGKGIGRYGSAQLPDVTFAADGSIHPIHEFMLLGGATLHATKMLDIYAFAGEEQEESLPLDATYGVGLLSANNSGCLIEGGACAGNTRRVRQITGGFWQKIYNGSFGRAQVGFQYSHTERELFQGVGGAPQAAQDMGFVSFRYYPF